MKYRSLPVRDFDLDYTISSGQVFNWDYKDGFWLGTIKNALFKIRQNGDKLFFISNLPEKTAKQRLKKYFNLTTDLSTLIKDIDKDETIHKAVSSFRGLRVVNVPPWECAVSFLLSINTNIPRIKKMIGNLCSKYGRQVSVDGINRYTFPSPEKLLDAGLLRLKKLKLGFRARYLFEFARKIKGQKNFLEYLKKDRYDIAKCKLTNCLGIGPKVADCVLLYSYDKAYAFPVDVWIRRAMTRYYGDKIRAMFCLKKNENIKDAHIRDFATGYFGRYAGWAQVYLYCYARKELKT